jgi:hypothetical protein
LFGGARLAGQLLEAGLIDSIDIAIMPVVLGQGTRLFDTAMTAKFRAVDQRVLAHSGVVVFDMAIPGHEFVWHRRLCVTGEGLQISRRQAILLADASRFGSAYLGK